MKKIAFVVAAFIAAGLAVWLGRVKPDLGQVPLTPSPELDPKLGTADQAAAKQIGLVRQVNHDLSPAAVADARELVGKNAPDFELPTTHGDTWKLADHVATKPVLLFFVEGECPCCIGAKAFVERVRQTYSDKLDVAAVIDDGEEKGRLWEKATDALFPVALDPDQRVIHLYGAKRGVYTLLISPASQGEPKIVKAFPGYSKQMLLELSQTVASLAAIPVRTVDTAHAPDHMVSGCQFPTLSPKATS